MFLKSTQIERTMQPVENKPHENLTDLLGEVPTLKDDQIERLQKKLDYEHKQCMHSFNNHRSIHVGFRYLHGTL